MQFINALPSYGSSLEIEPYSQESFAKMERNVKWVRSFDYFLCLLGWMVGLGNIWRFPYLCYKNGGGAFLVAYWTYIGIFIFPLLVLESGLGQFTGFSPTKAWNLVPLFRGIGNAAPFLVFYCNLFYPLLLAWSLRWFVASFSSELPWTRCDNEWNTPACVPLLIDALNGTELAAKMTSGVITNETAPSSLNITEQVINMSRSIEVNGTTSSVEEFWRINILGLTSGIEDLGGMKTDVLLCFTIIWVATYFSIWKGISWTSKVVYVTASLPIVMLIVVTVRGVTLEGADDGLRKYAKPEMSSLGKLEVWKDAASQALFSLGTAAGGLTALSSYNKFHHNFFRDSVLITCLNALASSIAGLAIFSVLGFLAREQNVTLDEVAESGPGLVFVIYPTALSLLPLPQFWSALFFLTLLFMGFDSMFVFQEALIACLRDAFGKIYEKKRSEFWIAVVCIFMYIVGLPMATRGGMYVLHLFNAYSITGWCLYFLSVNEFVAIGWFYGADKMLDNIKTMVGYEIPRWWIKICWKFIGPGIGLALMILSLLSYEPLEYDRKYKYPVWADTFGWLTTMSSVICVPVTAIYVVWHSEGNSILQKLRSSLVSRISRSELEEKKSAYHLGQLVVEEDARAPV